MPASRSASSKLINFSLCRPTPLVKKHSLGMKSSPLIIDWFSFRAAPKPQLNARIISSSFRAERYEAEFYFVEKISQRLGPVGREQQNGNFRILDQLHRDVPGQQPREDVFPRQPQHDHGNLPLGGGVYDCASNIVGKH